MLHKTEQDPYDEEPLQQIDAQHVRCTARDLGRDALGGAPQQEMADACAHQEGVDADEGVPGTGVVEMQHGRSVEHADPSRGCIKGIAQIDRRGDRSQDQVEPVLVPAAPQPAPHPVAT